MDFVVFHKELTDPSCGSTLNAATGAQGTAVARAQASPHATLPGSSLLQENMPSPLALCPCTIPFDEAPHRASYVLTRVGNTSHFASLQKAVP